MKKFLFASLLSVWLLSGAVAQAAVSTTYGSWVSQMQGDTVNNLYFEYVNGSPAGSAAGEIASSTPLSITSGGLSLSQPTVNSTVLQLGSGSLNSSSLDRGVIFYVSVDPQVAGAGNITITGVSASFNAAAGATINSVVQVFSDYDGNSLTGDLGTIVSGQTLTFQPSLTSLYVLAGWNQSVGTNGLQNFSLNIFESASGQINPTVPEPSSLLLFAGIGLLSFVGWRRQRGATR